MCFKLTDCVFLHSYPRSKEEEIKTKNVWLKGHTGMLSILKNIYSLTQFIYIMRFWHYHNIIQSTCGCTSDSNQRRALEMGQVPRKCTCRYSFFFLSISLYSDKSFVEFKRQVINAGDALEFLSGGFYRATIHRYYLFSFSSLSRTPN
jgi:hypothetical protein